MNYQPRSIYDNEGILGVSIWIRKMESIFHTNSWVVNYHERFMTYTLWDVSLEWWNNYKNTMGVDSAYATTWENLNLILIEKYYLREKTQEQSVVTRRNLKIISYIKTQEYLHKNHYAFIELLVKK